MTTQQTTEFIAAVLAVSIRRKANLADDGKEGTWELIGYLGDRGVIKTGIEGLSQIPAELADLKPDEVPRLAADVSLVLNVWGVNHRRQDITSEVIRAIVDAIPAFKDAYRHWLVISNMPLTALPA